MSVAPVAFDTPRLRLRKPTATDASEIFRRYASDPEVTRYLAWARHRAVADSLRFVTFSNETWERLGVGPYLAFSKDTGELLGSTGLDLGEEGLATTGYVLARDAWGHGYGAELVNAMSALAVHLGLVQLIAYCHADNARSRRLLERSGFELMEVEQESLYFPNFSDEPSDVAAYVREFGAHVTTEHPIV